MKFLVFGAGVIGTLTLLSLGKENNAIMNHLASFENDQVKEE